MIKPVEYEVSCRELEGDMIDRLLNVRGINQADLDDARIRYHDPFLINDMDKATERILQARRRQEKVLVFADYDADGSNAAAVMVRGLRKVGIEAAWKVPDRMKDGYGMTMKPAKEVLEMGVDLVITVDNGIASIEESRMLMEHGIDVIITDHHHCKEVLPPAFAVLNHQRADNTYPFPAICGAAMAYKLICALCQREGLPAPEELLPYVAVATVADVMPLVDENRLFVREGLKRMAGSAFPGVRELYSAGTRDGKKDCIKAMDVAFYVAPLINAASRVGDVQVALRMLLSDDAQLAKELKEQLLEFNMRRKRIEARMTAEAFGQVLDYYDFSSLDPIIVFGDEWHKGVIGIVASRLVEKFNRPAFVFGRMNETEPVYHGSARSCQDINLMDLLAYAGDELEQYGGHPGAAGMTIRPDQIEAFRQQCSSYAHAHFSPRQMMPTEKADLLLRHDELTLENYDRLASLEPFGHGNQEPIFMVQGLKVSSISRIGKEKNHLKILFKTDAFGGDVVEAVGFSKGEYADLIPVGRCVDAVFTMADNEFRGRRLQLMLKDILFTPAVRAHLSSDCDQQYAAGSLELSDLCVCHGFSLDDLRPSKEEFNRTYKVLKSLFESSEEIAITSLEYLCPVIEKEGGLNGLSPFKLGRILDVLRDAGAIRMKRALFGQIVLSLAVDAKITPLSQTQAYRRMCA